MSKTPTEWHIKRNCSASPRQLALVFASLVAVSFAFGVGFAAYGLWMVLPFVGIELVAVALAFFCYGRHAADCEHIDLRDGEIHVLRVDGPRRTEWHWPALWAQVEVRTQRGALLQQPRVILGARGESVEIGRLLPDDRRLQLAQELKRALRIAAA